MASHWYHLVIDAVDPPALARFWADALQLDFLFEAEDEVVIGRDLQSYPGICFVPVREAKSSSKNRLHIDLNPDDRDAEVERLIALGASKVDIGQGEVTWIVLTDPEGNEFCVLGPHTSLIG